MFMVILVACVVQIFVLSIVSHLAINPKAWGSDCSGVDLYTGCRRTNKKKSGAYRSSQTEIPPEDAYGGRIVGGMKSDISLYPYQLSLQYLGLHSCGASLIDRKWALTAAHCVFGIFTNFLSIRAGATGRQSGGEVIQVRNKYIHKKFNKNTIDYDLALLELNDFVDPDFAEIVPLPAVGQKLKEGDIGVVAGWGITGENSTMAKTLMVVEIPVLNQIDCKRIMGHMVTNRMFCAGYITGGKDACQGDSGGPFIANGVQMGIISWGFGCGRPREPGVYTNVAVLRRYIKQISGV